MGESRGNLRGIVSLELDSEYAFPFFEGAFGAVTFLSFWFVLSSYFGWSLVVIPSEWDGASVIYAYARLIPTLATLTLGGCMWQFSFLFVVTIPVLVALSIARELESGMMRTKLSYPIGRSALLLAKGLIITSVTAVPASLMSLGAVFLFEPGSKDIAALAIQLISLWILVVMVISISVLTSLVFRGLPSALFSGLVLSFGFTQLPFFISDSPVWVAFFCNPVYGAVRVLDSTLNESMLETAIGLSLAIVFVVLLLAISMKLFSRMEV